MEAHKVHAVVLVALQEAAPWMAGKARATVAETIAEGLSRADGSSALGGGAGADRRRWWTADEIYMAAVRVLNGHPDMLPGVAMELASKLIQRLRTPPENCNVEDAPRPCVTISEVWQPTMELRWIECALEAHEVRWSPTFGRVSHKKILQQRWEHRPGPWRDGKPVVEEEWRDVPTVRE